MDHSNKSSEQENISSTGSGDGYQSLQTSGEEQDTSNTQSEEISSVASDDTAGISQCGSTESTIKTAAGEKRRGKGKGLMYDRGKWTVVSKDPNSPNFYVTSLHDRMMAGETLEELYAEGEVQVCDFEQQGKQEKPKLDHDDEDCKTAAADDALNKLPEKKDDTDSGNADLYAEGEDQVSDSEQQGKPKKPKFDHDDEDCKTAAADDALNKLPEKKDDTDSGNADLYAEGEDQVSDSEQQGKPKKPKLDHDDEDCKTASADDVLNKLQEQKNDGDDDTDSGNAGLSGKPELK